MDYIIKENKIITSKVLRKKHKQRYRSIHFVEGDFIDKLLNEMSSKYNLTRKAIFREAIIYYKLFMENNFKKEKK